MEYVAIQCVDPENIHTPPMEGFFGLNPPTPLEIPVKPHTFLFKILAFETPLELGADIFLELHNADPICMCFVLCGTRYTAVET